MDIQTVIGKVSFSKVFIFLIFPFLVFTLEGCASTPAVTGPGTPDEIQMQHYEMVKSAIEAKSKKDALAGLALLQADVSRWREGQLTIMKAFVDQATLTDAVDEEDWDRANTLVEELTIYYRGSL